MTQNSNSNINILVVDDDREIAQAIEIYLRNEGYNVFKAYDGLEAINVAEKEDLHLIIMDIMMPKLDGHAGAAEGQEYPHHHAFGKIRGLRQDHRTERRG